MMASISLKRVRFKSEDRFIIFAAMRQEKRTDPFMRTSNLGNPLTKEEAMNDLQKMELSEEDINRLVARAESDVA